MFEQLFLSLWSNLSAASQGSLQLPGMMLSGGWGGFQEWVSTYEHRRSSALCRWGGELQGSVISNKADSAVKLCTNWWRLCLGITNVNWEDRETHQDGVSVVRLQWPLLFREAFFVYSTPLMERSQTLGFETERGSAIQLKYPEICQIMSQERSSTLFCSNRASRCRS